MGLTYLNTSALKAAGLEVESVTISEVTDLQSTVITELSSMSSTLLTISDSSASIYNVSVNTEFSALDTHLDSTTSLTTEYVSSLSSNTGENQDGASFLNSYTTSLNSVISELESGGAADSKLDLLDSAGKLLTLQLNPFAKSFGNTADLFNPIGTYPQGYADVSVTDSSWVTLWSHTINPGSGAVLYNGFIRLDYICTQQNDAENPIALPKIKFSNAASTLEMSVTNSGTFNIDIIGGANVFHDSYIIGPIYFDSTIRECPVTVTFEIIAESGSGPVTEVTDFLNESMYNEYWGSIVSPIVLNVIL